MAIAHAAMYQLPEWGTIITTPLPSSTRARRRPAYSGMSETWASIQVLSKRRARIISTVLRNTFAKEARPTRVASRLDISGNAPFMRESVRSRLMRKTSNTNHASRRAMAQATTYGNAFTMAHTMRSTQYSQRLAKSDFLFFATQIFYIKQAFPATPKNYFSLF